MSLSLLFTTCRINQNMLLCWTVAEADLGITFWKSDVLRKIPAGFVACIKILLSLNLPTT